MSPTVKQEIERLIINWGYWKSGAGEVAGCSFMAPTGTGDSWSDPRMPLLFGEARHTDQALNMLHEPQVVVLKAHYLTNLRKLGTPASGEEQGTRDLQDLGAEREGDQARMKADELGLSRATFYRLLANAQKSFWLAFQLVKAGGSLEDEKKLDDVRRIADISASLA